MFFYVTCAVFLWYTKLKVNGMLLKWKLSKLFSENKEANKELDEWLRPTAAIGLQKLQG